MRLINADRLQRVDHIILESDVDNAPTIDAIPRKAIDDAIAEIESLKGDNFPNSYYVGIIKKHIAEVEK